MKPRKKAVLIMLLGLLLFAFAAGMAQSPAQGDQKKTEACCSMESCCCNGGSCPMKEGASSADAKDADCCCNGDSCDMKAKDGQNHADHPSCCENSCKMKHDTKNHDAKNHDARGECCKIKNKAKAKQKAA